MRAPGCHVRVTRADRLPQLAYLAKVVDTGARLAGCDLDKPAGKPDFVEVHGVREWSVEPEPAQQLRGGRGIAALGKHRRVLRARPVGHSAKAMQGSHLDRGRKVRRGIGERAAAVQPVRLQHQPARREKD